MTQKELSYVKDAIEHEKSIMSIYQKLLNDLTEEELTEFIENEINKHNETKEELINLLESEVNG